MNKEMKEFLRRRGYVKIRRDFIISNLNDLRLIKRMQCHMFIMDTDYNFTNDIVTFWGCSEEFESVPEGVMSPEYRAVFKKDDFVGFEKVE